MAVNDYAVPEGLDPTAFILTKAIKRSETSGSINPYEAKGDNATSTGAYQIQDTNWSPWASKYLGDANAPRTEENQNKLAYSRVKDLLDQGYTQSQVASMWNSGHADPNTVGKGYNSRLGVNYDVPGYVSKVQKNYEQVQKEIAQGYNSNPYSNPDVPSEVSPTASPTEPSRPQEKGLTQQLMGRANDVGQAVNETLGGKINPLSGLIQGVGAVAGGVNDIVNKGLEFIPGFKGLENLVGKGVGALAKTEVGQSVANSMQKFSDAHPELSKDIGAGFNIATAIPIFEGLGSLANIGKDAASVALRNVAEKGAVKDLTEVVSRVGGGREMLKTVPDGLKTLVDERALPEIAEGRYNVNGAMGRLTESISKIDEAELQPILEEVSKRQNFGQNLVTLKKLAIDEVKNDATLKEAGMVQKALKQVDNRFDDWVSSYGDSVNLSTENRLKIGTGKFSDWKTPEGSADKAIYRALQKDIERTAEKNGLGDVSAINKKMARLIKAQKLLKYISDKSVKNTGIVHGLIRGAATAGGELAGNAAGIPIAGAVVGNRTAGFIERSLSGLSPRAMREGILTRTAPNAARQTVGGTTRKVGGLIGASIANRQANQ